MFHDECDHAFVLPALLQVPGATLAARVGAWGARVAEAEAALARNQAEIDEITFRLYGIEGEDRRAIEASLGRAESAEVDEAGDEDEDEGAEAAPAVDPAGLAAALVSWAVGCVFGRWDVRLALDPSLAPALQGPFEPLPVCSPGMLVGPDGLPATRTTSATTIAREEWLRARPNAISLPPEGSVAEPLAAPGAYPLAVDWDGILVDDPGHPDDIVQRVRDVLELLWGRPESERIEDELCQALGVADLREYLRNPRRFWDDHVRTYSKSRRKAPIYWLLQSARRNYAVWIYYHRMDRDILYKALANYATPALNRERIRLEELEARLPEAVAAGGRVRREAERAVERQTALVAEIAAFRAELERVAHLGLTVDHDDGVLLSIAPLHALVPWRPARQAWEELTEGKYTWSSMSQQLRERGLVGERHRVRPR